MKLLINTSAVPFNDADQRTICLVGAGMSGGSNGSDRNAGRLCAADGSAAGSCSALWSPEEDARRVGSEGNGPTPGGQGLLRVFGVTPCHPGSLTAAGFRCCSGVVADAAMPKHHESWRNREAQDCYGGWIDPCH